MLPAGTSLFTGKGTAVARGRGAWRLGWGWALSLGPAPHLLLTKPRGVAGGADSSPTWAGPTQPSSPGRMAEKSP